MPQQADVKSVDALKYFRSSLILYVSKARPTLEEAAGEVRRVKMWLQNEQRVYWDHQIRHRTKILEEAQQNYFGARLANLREATTSEMSAVRRAKRSLDQAENKAKMIKKWTREFDNRVEPLLRQLEKLHTVLSNDMTKGIAYMAQIIDTLEAYADKAQLISISGKDKKTAAGESPATAVAAAKEKP